jgi:hypothetical protein
MKNGYAFAGSNAYLATKISSVKEIFSELMEELQNAMNFNTQKT